MANPKNREAVEQALQQELERDRTKTYVVEISPLGLVEMTRQNVTDGPREILTRKCPTCAGEGVVVSEATAVVDAERRLRALAASKPRTKAFKVELNAHVAELLIGPGRRPARARSRRSTQAPVLRRRARRASRTTTSRCSTRARSRSSPSTGAPVEEGQTLEVKLVEVGRHDAGAGVGKLDGWPVCVGGAAKLVGKKVKVRIARVLDGIAYAALVDGRAGRGRRADHRRGPGREADARLAGEEARARSEPAAEDVESEPRRSRPSSRGRGGGRRGRALEAEDGEAEVEPVAEEPVAGARRRRRRPGAARAAAAGARRSPPPRAAERGRLRREADPDAMPRSPRLEPGDRALRPMSPPTRAPPKKKTRRGSRGGRGRKKKPAARPTAGRGDERPARAGAGRAAAPTIHVPDAGSAGRRRSRRTATSPPRPRKKTRRGSRGGRRRRKPAGGRRPRPSRRPRPAQTRARTSLSDETRGPSQPTVPSCSHSSCGARISTGRHPGAGRALELAVGAVADEERSRPVSTPSSSAIRS